MPNPIAFLTPLTPRKIDTIQLDVVVDEMPRHSVALTRHPVEVPATFGVRRGEVSDNAYLEPTEYRMRGAVSDFPLSWRLFSELARDPYAASSAATRSLSAWEILLAFFRSMTPFDLETPLGLLENMLFTELSAPRDSWTASAVVFEAKFREVQFVVPDTIIATRTVEDVAPGAEGAADITHTGAVAGSVVESGSLLHQGVSAVAELVP